jgi:squalene-associated FAD-dependent desaturase
MPLDAPAAASEGAAVTAKGNGGRVAVVGGGLAGLAVATHLVQEGVSVELFEASRRLGGRAGSFVEPTTGRTTDYGQHVSMGCCTALADLLRQTSLEDTFETHRQLTFVDPTRRQYRFGASGWLPAPAHLLPSLLRLRFLTFAERCQIIRAMRTLQNAAGGENASNDEPMKDWLIRHGQSPQAIARFWAPVLISALSETLDRVSLRVARKVIVDGLMTSRRGYELEIPRLPLAEIFDQRLGGWLEREGVRVHRLTPVTRIERGAAGVRELTLRDGRRIACDVAVIAVPWHRVGRVLSPELAEAVPGLARSREITAAAITTVHLDYDRPITHLPHAMLIDRLGQWVFTKPDNRVQVVISASHRLVNVSRDELADQIEHELAEVFPAAASSRVLHRRVVIQPRAVFSASPGIDALRPTQETPAKNVVLAGDWTTTGWPATMEGAVRSGRAAADAVLHELTG